MTEPSLQSICPYYAMFPASFAARHIGRWTKPGDLVLDPFCGRGTTVYQALRSRRKAIGLDINPVAFCITAAKIERVGEKTVVQRIGKLEMAYRRSDHDRLRSERQELPAFFRRAFFHETLNEILYLRNRIDWKRSPADRFVAALVLGSLHGEMNKSHSYFSNQMPRTISTKPRYSLAYWKRHRLWPRRRDVFRILHERAHMRLDGEPIMAAGRVRLGDVRSAYSMFPRTRHRVSAIVTSPPYLDVTNLAEDQWLRLWFLGGPPEPMRNQLSGDDRYYSKERYWKFIHEAWKGIMPMVAPSATLVCRIGGRHISTHKTTLDLTESLRTSFPDADLKRRPKITRIRNSQSRAFRRGPGGCTSEIDYTFGLGPVPS